MGLKLLLVCAGGAVGSGARYLISLWMAARFDGGFPLGTWTVNIAGSFLLTGLMQISMAGDSISPDLRIALATGLLGGFTTYSTFNYETTVLLQKGAFLLAGGYVLATVLGCLIAGWMGLVAARAMVG